MKTYRFAGAALLAVVLCATVTRGSLMAYEPFNYSPGNMTSGTATTATGFSGTWFTLINPASDYAAVTAGSLPYPAMPISYNKLENGHNRMTAGFDTGVFSSYIDGSGNIGLDGTTLYMGVLIRGNLNTFTGFSAFELFKDGDADANRRLTIDRWSGHGDSGASAWLSAWNVGGSATTAASPIIIAGVSTHLYVLKISFGASNADTVSVYADPAITATPTEPLVPSASVSITDASFDRLVSSEFGGNLITIDEVRVGTGYADVVPEPSSLGLVLVSSLALLRRRASRVAS